MGNETCVCPHNLTTADQSQRPVGVDRCCAVDSPFVVIGVAWLIVFHDFSLRNDSTCYWLNLFNSSSADLHVGQACRVNTIISQLMSPK